MNIIIAPDIFGHTPALTRLAKRLTNRLGDASRLEIIDPYGDQRFFRQETRAYNYFSTHLDIIGYSDIIKKHLAEIKGPVTLLGFSAGASAIWYFSSRVKTPGKIRGIGFYGSQIRNHTDLCPKFEIDLIFPDTESHFNVDDLIRKLNPSPGLTISKADGQHGFMNEYSKNYSSGLCNRFVNTLIPMILNQENQIGRCF